MAHLLGNLNSRKELALPENMAAHVRQRQLDSTQPDGHAFRMGTRAIYDEELHAYFVTFSCYRRRRLLDHDLVRDKTYMHENPVRAGLVADPCDWAFSSARYYAQGRSVGVPIRWIA